MKHRDDIGARYSLSGDALEILLYSDIGSGSASAAAVTRLLKSSPSAKQIVVHINSLGGSAFDGIAIYNQLRNHPAHVVVNIDGVAASAASVIAMAGDDINIAPNAMLMIHGTQTLAEGSAEDLDRQVRSLRALNDGVADVYARRTGIDRAVVLEMMTSEKWIGAEEAVELGFATKVSEPKSIAARVGGMRRLEVDEDETTMMDDGTEEKEVTSEGEDETESVDATSLLDRLAESTGFDKSAVLAALLEMQDELSEALMGVIGEDGTPAEARAKVRSLKAGAVEGRVKDDQIKSLRASVDSLEKWKSDRVRRDVEDFVDGKIAAGFVRPEQRADAIEIRLDSAERFDRLFAVKVVPTGEQAPVGKKSGADLSEDDLTPDEKVQLAAFRGARIKNPLARVIALRGQGAN